jgi:TRAP-type C4-dicarboxylate transport system permease small subunit
MNQAIRAVNMLSRVTGVIAALMIVAAVAITCQMIFLRYFLNASTVWQTEIVVYLMIASTLLGLPYVQQLKGHVNVDLVPLMLPPVPRKLLLVFSLLAGAVVLGIMAFYGGEITYLAFSKNWTSDTVTAVPLWIPYISMPIGFGLFTLQLLVDMHKLIKTPAVEINIEIGGH